MLRLGQLLDDIQADYIPGLSELKAVRRSVVRVFDEMNSKLEGIDVFDKGLELIVAPTTESVTFDDTYNTITPATTPSSIEPGDVIVVYGTDYNNEHFVLSWDNSGTLQVMPSDSVFVETISCTYAIYRPWREAHVNRLPIAALTYDNAKHGLTVGGSEIDFLEAGIKVGDYLTTLGAPDARNNAMFEALTVDEDFVTIKTAGHAGKIADDTADVILSIYSANPTYAYDAENHRIALPSSVKKLQQIYDGDITERVDIESDTYTSANDDTVRYSATSRNTYSLTADLFTAAENVLTFKVRRDLTAPASAYRDAGIDVPGPFEHAVKKGVLQDLLSLPQYSNEKMYKDQKSLFMVAMAELFDTELHRNRDTQYQRDYNW